MAPKSTPKVTLGVAQGRPKSIPEPGSLITDKKDAKGSQKGARCDPQNHEISNKSTQKHTLESIPAKVDEQALTRDPPNIIK